MIRRIIALLRPVQPRPEPVVDMADLIIAKRAAESRRSDAVAASYRRVHTIMKEGMLRHNPKAFEKLSGVVK